MAHPVKRIYDVIVGVVMIAVGGAFQLVFLVLLWMGIIGILEWRGIKVESEALHWVILIGLVLIFNGIAFWEYFRRRRMAHMGRPVRAVADAVVGVSSTTVAHIIFLIPRAIDRIFTGRERLIETPKNP